MAIDPNDKYALSSKGSALDGLGDYSGAITFLDKSLAIDPNDETALYYKDLLLKNGAIMIW